LADGSKAPKYGSPFPRRIGKLTTVGDIRKELAGLYRACRLGQYPVQDGARLAHMLAILVGG
jgi:hypothetical protein